MAKGDIVLITFPFTNLSGDKLRPSVVLAETQEDITVCFITTQQQWKESTDILVTPTTINGLHKPSIIRVAKIASLDKTLINGLLGRLTNDEILELNIKLKLVLKLD